jgi:glycosyltransferase involved in cell wall biosynthesis
MIHSRFHFFMLRAILNARLRRAMLKASNVFVFSESTRGALLHDGYPGQAMDVLSEAVHVPIVIPPRDRAKRRIGVVSRLNYSKGVQDVLVAAPRVLRDFPSVEFLIAGDGRYRSSLERFARRLKIESSVHFLGFRPDPWHQVLPLIEVLAHPTFDRGDSMPLALLEAGAAGIPVVTTHWNGIPEIVRDGITGILVPPRDVIALADGLKALLRDPSRSAAMGIQARNWVREKFSIGNVADRFLRVLNGQTEPRSELVG